VTVPTVNMTAEASMAKRTATVHIGSKKWKIRVCKVPADRLGDCNDETGTIRVSEKLVGVDFVEVLLHELIHARWWCLDEGEVTEFAEEASAVLEAFGVTREEDEDG
jgi:hypothetical protein